MARIIVTTCGTSLLESSCWKHEDLNTNFPIHAGGNAEERQLKRSSCKDVIKALIAQPNGVNTLANSFDRGSWDDLEKLRDVPAELSSLRVFIEALNNKETPEELRNEDKIVLLHSTNEEGEFCGKILEKVLGLILTNVIVERKPVPGLDFTTATELNTAIKNIWDEYVQLLINAGETKYIFNLTGGYKATSMLLASCAALSHSNTMARIIYIHEDTPPQNLFVMQWENGDLKLGLVADGRPADTIAGGL